MRLKIYSLNQQAEWDAIIRSFQNYDVYYLSGYVRAFQIHGDGEPLLFMYEDSGIRAINVVMKRDIGHDKHFLGKIATNTWFDFITPYGYGGWLIEGDGTRSHLFQEYEKWCRDNCIVSEFVRFHPVLRNHEYAADAYEIVALGGTIALDLSSPETIWENLTSKNRNMIRKAKKSGVVVYNGRYPDIFDKFRDIYNATMDKDNADMYYYFGKDFYESVLKDLPTEAQVFYAEVEGKVIAASIILAAGGCLNYHLSGSLREYYSLAPTNLILYEAALWGSTNGCRSFHLGGGVGSREDSLYKFKKAFYRGEPCRFHIGKKIFDGEKYKEFTDMRTNLCGNDFFPQYRGD